MRVMLTAVLLVCTSSAFGQVPVFTKAETALVEAVEAADGRMMVLDAFLLCPILLVREPQAQLDDLESDEWAMSLHFQDSDNPIFSDYEGTKTYEDDRSASLYVGAEFYPDTQISYCSYTLTGDTADFSLALVEDLFDAEVETVAVEDGTDQYASWNLDLDALFLGRAERTKDSMYVQYTLIAPN